MCNNCLNYSKRLEKCKLKSDRITTNGQGKCIQFSKITEDILLKRKKQEKYFHKLFADCRTDGEWFKLSKTDIKNIKNGKYLKLYDIA